MNELGVSIYWQGDKAKVFVGKPLQGESISPTNPLLLWGKNGKRNRVIKRIYDDCFLTPFSIILYGFGMLSIVLKNLGIGVVFLIISGLLLLVFAIWQWILAFKIWKAVDDENTYEVD